MVNYSCDKCGKTFKQKGHYTKHLQRKTPCEDIKDKIEKIVENKVDELVQEKLQDLVEKGDIEIKNKNLISNNQQNNTNMEIEKEYLSNYLSEIKSSSKNTKYKRVCLSPLRYAGGKSKAVGLILENFPALKEKKVVSPFFGGGSFEIVLSKNLGYEVIGYDIFSFLTNFWDQIINNNENFIHELKKLIPDKENYTRNRHILLNYWEKVKPSDLEYKTLNKLELTEEEKIIMDNNKTIQAAYYYYNMQLSYGPMFLGWPSSVYLKKDRYNKILGKLENIDLGNLSVKCDVFENVIQNHCNDFLFLDPPYYLGEDSKMFKGMYPNCNFAIHHNGFNHELMRDLLKNHKGGFFITYNDCPTIREWYKEFKQIYPKWQYTYGQGEKRVGKNRKNKKEEEKEDGEIETDKKDNVKESHEIFIICEPQ